MHSMPHFSSGLSVVNTAKALIFASVLLNVGTATTARASSSTWTTTSGAQTWTTSANWSGGVIAGATGTTNNTDTATFTTPTATETITIDSGRNLQNFVINTAGFGYTFNGGPLTLTGGGSLVLNGTTAGIATSFSTTVATSNANIVNLECDYGFFANTGLLNLKGAGVNQAYLENATGTITLGGNSGAVIPNGIPTGPGVNTFNTVNVNFNQAAGSILSLTKTGSGVWAIITANGNPPQIPLGSNYTGTTTIDGGVLSVSLLANEGSMSSIGAGAGVAAAGSDLVLNGGELQYSGYIGTATPNETNVAGQFTNRLFTIGDNTSSANTADIDSSNPWLAGYGSSQSTISFTGTGAIAFGTQHPGTHVLTLSGINIGNNTFNPQINDQTGVGGGATSLVKTGPGTWILGGSNSYTGTTTINGGILGDLTGSGVSKSSALAITNGVYQSAGNITRSLGTGTGNVSITGGRSGFSANSGAVTLTLGTPGTPVQFGSANFNPTEYILNAPTANNTLTATDSYDLNGGSRTIETDAATAIMTGAIVNNASGTTAGFNKAGNGVLELQGNNTFNGLVGVSGGVLWAQGSGTLGTNTGVVNVGSGSELRLDTAAALPGTVLLNQGTLGLNFNASQATISGMLNQASTGVVAFNGAHNQALNMSTLGNGQLYLGSSTGGTYSASTLTAVGGTENGIGSGTGTFGGNYLLGGGGGQLTITSTNVLTDQASVFLLPNSSNQLRTSIDGAASSTTNTRNSVTIGNSQVGMGGTIDLQAAQSYTGNTTINAGSTLNLDFTTQAPGTNNILNSANQVILQGGTLEMTGAATGSNSQTLGGVSTTFGASAIQANGSSATFNVGTVNAAAGTTVDFIGNGGTINVGNSSLNAGQFLYTNGATTTFANLSGTSVTALSGQTTLTTAAVTTPTTDYVLNNTGTAALSVTPAGNDTINTLTIGANSTGATTLVLGANTLTTNGIINTSTGTGSIQISGTAGKPGITSTNPNLYIYNYATNSSLGNTFSLLNSGSAAVGPGGLGIFAPITGLENVVFGGPGVITLGGLVSTTGNVYLNGAQLLVQGASLANTGSLVINSGSLANFGSTSQVVMAQNQQWNGNFSLLVPSNSIASTAQVKSTGTVTLTNNITITVDTENMGGGTGVGGGINAVSWTYGGNILDNGYGYGLTIGINSLSPYNPNASSFLNQLNGGVQLSGTNQFTGPLTVLGDSIEISSTASTTRNNLLLLGSNSTAFVNAATVNLSGLQDAGAASSTESIIALGNDTITLWGSGNYSFGGVIQDTGTNTTNGSTAATKASLSMSGTGTQTLTGNNTFTGAVSINAGNLIVDNSQGGALAGTNALTMGGGTLTVKSAKAGTTQNFASTAISAGGSMIVGDNSNGGTLTVGLAAVGAPAVGGTLDIVAKGSTAPTFTTSSVNNSNGTLGASAGHIVFTDNTGKTTWASVAGGNIGTYNGDTTNLATTGGSTAINYQLTGSQTQTGNTSASLLRITNTTAGSLDLNGKTLNVNGDGILFNGTANYSIVDSVGAGSIFGATGDKEVIIQNYDTTAGTALTLGAAIGNNGANLAALTIAGPGTTILTGSNTYGGGANLNGPGTVNFNGMANFGTGTSPIALNGATLQYASGNTADLSARTVTFNPAGGTIDTNGNNVTYANTGFGTGTGSATFVDSSTSGTGSVTIAGTTGYQGSTIIKNGGTVVLGSSGKLSTGLNTIVGNGGKLMGGGNAGTGNSAGVVILQSGGLIAPGGGTGVQNVQGVGLDGQNIGATRGTNNVLNMSTLTFNAGGTLKFELDNTIVPEALGAGTAINPSASTQINLGQGALVKGNAGVGQFVLDFGHTGTYDTTGIALDAGVNPYNDGGSNIYALIAFGGTSLTGGLDGNTNFNIDDFTIKNLNGIGVLSFWYNASANQEELLLTVVPEPSTWAMLIGGLASVVFWTRKRRRTIKI